MPRIEIGRVSMAMGAPAEILRGLGLSAYRWPQDRTQPAILFGIYFADDVVALRKHEGPATLFVCGVDAKGPGVVALREMRGRIRIVCQAGVASSLRQRGIEPDLVRHVYLGDPVLFTPQPLGAKVYCYLPYPRRHEYGLAMVEAVAAKFPDVTFLLGRWGDMPLPFPNAESTPLWQPMSQQPETYSQCFAGIRTVSPDGFGGSLVELALMGRPVAHVLDLDLPFIHWAPSVDALASFIRESREATEPNLRIAAMARDFVTDHSFLDIPAP